MELRASRNYQPKPQRSESLRDGVALEFGPSRQRDLSLRRQITSLQPRLRLIFITQVALQKYRARVPGFQLPAGAQPALEEFGEHLARTLEAMADRLEGKEPRDADSLQNSMARLERASRTFDAADTFLLLSRRIGDLAMSLDQELVRQE
jgi:multidrug resistance protein MdtO